MRLAIALALAAYAYAATASATIAHFYNPLPALQSVAAALTRCGD